MNTLFSWDGRRGRLTRRAALKALAGGTLALVGPSGRPGRAAQPVASPVAAEAVAGRVDIGSRSLFRNATGAGSPALILESGLGGDSSAWRFVQRRVEAFTQV